MCGKLLEFLRDQPGTGARQRRDATQVEDHELGPMLRGELPRNVVDVGQGERADELDHPDLLVMDVKDIAFMRAATAPRPAR